MTSPTESAPRPSATVAAVHRGSGATAERSVASVRQGRSGEGIVT
jgi:hypothetical protein